MKVQNFQTFQLETPVQLLTKLAWGINQLKAALRSKDLQKSFFPSVYISFDCAITAWQVSDWIHGFVPDRTQLPQSADPKRCGNTLKGFQAWACEQNQNVRICKHIANSNKHYGVDYHNDSELQVSVSWKVESQMSAGMPVGRPLVERSYRLVVSDSGQEFEVLEVFKGALQFWAELINEPSLIGLCDQ